MKFSQFQASTVDTVWWRSSPRERRDGRPVRGRIKPLIRKEEKFIIKSNEGELTASGEVGFREEDALRERMAASEVSPVIIDIAARTVQTAFEGGLAGLEVSCATPIADATMSQAWRNHPDFFLDNPDYIFLNGSIEVRMGPVRMIITGTKDPETGQDITLDHYIDGHRIDDMPLSLVIEFHARHAVHEAGLVVVEEDGRHDGITTETDGYSDVDGTVDIRVGPLHVFIIWREDDTGIEN